MGRYVPAIRKHDDIAAHLSEDYLSQWDTMSVVSAITVEHEHRRSRGGKLTSLTFGDLIVKKKKHLTYLLVRWRALVPLYRRLAYVQRSPL